MPKPLSIVRLKQLSEFIPIGRTVRDELIAQGLLKMVPLTPKGRAKGITLESIVEYQRRYMRIEPLPDNAAETSEV